jgi:hypothetical protein
MYAPGRWLLPGRSVGEMATLPPVALHPNEFWTDDFTVAARRSRSGDTGKPMVDSAPPKAKVTRGAKR